MKEFIEEILARALKDHEEAHRIAPNSYGEGVEWGVVETCRQILQEMVAPEQGR